MTTQTIVKVTSSFSEMTDSEIKGHIATVFELDTEALDILVERKPDMKTVLCCCFARRPLKSPFLVATGLSDAFEAQVFFTYQNNVEIQPNGKR